MKKENKKKLNTSLVGSKKKLKIKSSLPKIKRPRTRGISLSLMNFINSMLFFVVGILTILPAIAPELISNIFTSEISTLYIILPILKMGPNLMFILSTIGLFGTFLVLLSCLILLMNRKTGSIISLIGTILQTCIIYVLCYNLITNPIIGLLVGIYISILVILPIIHQFTFSIIGLKKRK